MSVITLIGNQSERLLTESYIETIVGLLQNHGLDVMKMRWLGAEEAVQIKVTEEDLRSLRLFVRPMMGDKPIDVFVQKEVKLKRMLISDMDSTMIGIECIDEIADYMGIKKEVAAITERAMRGELNFEASLTERVLLLKGLDEAVLEQTFRERLIYNKGAKTLIATMKQQGATTILVSGGFNYFTKRVAEYLGFDYHHGNHLDILNGIVTGKVEKPILGAEAKERLLAQYQQALQVDRDDILAIGDGANDVKMLKEAGMGVAYYAKPHVQDVVDFHINHTDLTSLLYVQGYNKEAFITSETH